MSDGVLNGRSTAVCIYVPNMIDSSGRFVIAHFCQNKNNSCQACGLTGDLFCIFVYRPNAMAKFSCYVMGMGIKGISCDFGFSRNTVRKYVSTYQDNGLSCIETRLPSCDHPFGAVYGRRRILPEFPFRCSI